MRFQDLHTHSVFDDGSAALEDMVKAAIAGGLYSIGFSGHSTMDGICWTIPIEKRGEYALQCRALQKKYAGQIAVFCGMEWDINSELPPFETDYLIASNHFLGTGSERFEVDHTSETTLAGVNRAFGGDFALAEDTYYASFESVLDNPRADIIGHYDLITKFDEYRKSFRYAPPSALAMMEKLVKAGKIFEVNTGAICRSGRITPYPSIPLLRALHDMGGRVTLSSDSHGTTSLLFDFENQMKNLRECGFREIWILTGDGFVPEEI